MKNMQTVIRISDAQKAEIERLEAEGRYKIESIIDWAVDASREQLIAENFANLCHKLKFVEEPLRTRMQKSLEVLQCLGVK